MKYKAGDLVFLTRRGKGGYRSFISRSIARLTKRKDQNIEDVKVHAAILFDNAGVLTVRDMDKGGSRSVAFTDYQEMFGDRLEIVSMRVVLRNMDEFNERCLLEKVKYDYVNTFMWQVIRVASKRWVGTNTPYKRMCAEDASRMFNIIKPIFMAAERTNPNELYAFVIEHCQR